MFVTHFIPKMRSMIIAGALLSGATLAVSGLPAMADTTAAVKTKSCGTNVANLVDQCTSVTHSGTHVTSLSGWATHLWVDILSYPSVHEELYGPNGHIKNCRTISSWPPGDVTPTCTASLNVTKAGNYCSRTWSLTGTTWKILATECVPV